MGRQWMVGERRGGKSHRPGWRTRGRRRTAVPSDVENHQLKLLLVGLLLLLQIGLQQWPETTAQWALQQSDGLV